MSNPQLVLPASVDALRVVGVDAGPTPGIVRLDYVRGANGQVAKLPLGVDVVQCSHELFWDLLPRILGGQVDGRLVVLAYETYVVTRRSGRVTSGSANQITRAMADSLRQLHPSAIGRNAGQVKTWATDKRLDAAGISPHVKGMRHARDAARHALFAAVADGHAPDPLTAGDRA